MNSNMMDRLLDRYPPPPDLDKDDFADQAYDHVAPRKLPVEREIDLHGLTGVDATGQLETFIAQAARDGIRKVLIVHGKGSSPGSEGVLKALVRRYLEASPMVGATGHPGVELGGAGATWAVIRQRSR
ncbi:MAG: Smr/MutS family protein [Alkalispirochaeta sp.]